MINFKKEYKAILKKIKEANNIVILTHVSPDIDCLGSAFGLKEGLKQLSKNATIFNADQLPTPAFAIFNCEEIKKEPFSNDNFDLIISVDVATNIRHGIFAENFATHNNVIKIDHHLKSEVVNGVNLLNDKSSSCCEIICELFKFMKINFTEPLSTYLYAGMITDCGSFKYPNTNIQTFKHAIFLKEHNAKTNFLNDVIFRTKTLKEIKAQKYLYDKFELIDEKLALIVMDKKDLDTTKFTKQDCDFYSAALLDIEGVEISCSAIKIEDKLYKLSFRSSPEHDISKYCQALGGGGHKNAAGATITASKKQDAREIALKAMQDCFNDNEK